MVKAVPMKATWAADLVDKAVAEATEQRKEEHDARRDASADDDAKRRAAHKRQDGQIHAQDAPAPQKEGQGLRRADDAGVSRAGRIV